MRLKEKKNDAVLQLHFLLKNGSLYNGILLLNSNQKANKINYDKQNFQEHVLHWGSNNL